LLFFRQEMIVVLLLLVSGVSLPRTTTSQPRFAYQLGNLVETRTRAGSLLPIHRLSTDLSTEKVGKSVVQSDNRKQSKDIADAAKALVHERTGATDFARSWPNQEEEPEVTRVLCSPPNVIHKGCQPPTGSKR
jgi:hypothetical protein